MRVYEILTESQNLQEGPILNKIGSGVGKAVGTAAKGIGAVAGGTAGAFSALKKGYQAGKGVVSQGGDQDPATAQRATSASGTATDTTKKSVPAAQIKKDADTLIQNISSVRSRDRQAVVDYIKGKLDSVAKQSSAPTANQPAVKRNPNNPDDLGFGFDGNTGLPFKSQAERNAGLAKEKAAAAQSSSTVKVAGKNVAAPAKKIAV